MQATNTGKFSSAVEYLSNCICLQGKTNGHIVHPLTPLCDHSQKKSRNMPQDSNHGIFQQIPDVDGYFAAINVSQKLKR